MDECIWIRDVEDNDYFSTDCGHMFEYPDDLPGEWVWCPFCSKYIKREE